MNAWRLDCAHDALARVDQHDRQIGGRGAGDHVARVLLVPGGVGDDEPPLGGREVAVGDVDRDALLALGAQAVGQQRQVEEVAAHAALAGLLDVLQLVAEHLLGVVQQPPDQRALAVVDRARGGEAQQIGGALGEPLEHLCSRLGCQLRALAGRRRAVAVEGARRGATGWQRSAGHQKYPCRLRSSIAASVTRSSARV